MERDQQPRLLQDAGVRAGDVRQPQHAVRARRLQGPRPRCSPSTSTRKCSTRRPSSTSTASISRRAWSRIAARKKVLGVHFVADAVVHGLARPDHAGDPEKGRRIAAAARSTTSSARATAAIRRPSLVTAVVRPHAAGLFPVHAGRRQHRRPGQQPSGHRARRQMGKRDFFRYAARDGLQIPVYVTLPAEPAAGRVRPSCSCMAARTCAADRGNGMPRRSSWRRAATSCCSRNSAAAPASAPRFSRPAGSSGAARCRTTWPMPPPGPSSRAGPIPSASASWAPATAAMRR